MADYPTCRFAGVQSVITKSSRAKKHYEDMVTSDCLVAVLRIRVRWMWIRCCCRRVSSQLIRNVLRRMQTNPSAQERPKNLLHELKQVDGSEVLMTQTTGISHAVWLFKREFRSSLLSNRERTLRLSSHTEQIIGFHLGELALANKHDKCATLAVLWLRADRAWNTRAGFLGVKRAGGDDVCDFQVLQGENPRTWQKIQTFVIDKHFVEWQVSETCSRLAKCCFVNPTCWCTRTRPWRPSLVLHQLIGTLPSSALPNAVQVPSICFILLMHAC
ncbi:hypothetical protein GQ600_14398 [Phytophthora cactorum]|nr:hypothetical protein GQ600_14398 [Phytophthora cactorum]